MKNYKNCFRKTGYPNVNTKSEEVKFIIATLPPPKPAKELAVEKRDVYRIK